MLPAADGKFVVSFEVKQNNNISLNEIAISFGRAGLASLVNSHHRQPGAALMSMTYHRSQNDIIVDFDDSPRLLSISIRKSLREPTCSLKF